MGRMTATVHDSAQAPVYARLQEGSDAPDFTLPAIVPGTAENGLINLSDVLEDGIRQQRECEMVVLGELAQFLE